MVFRGGTERVSVVADKGGEGGYRKLAADEEGGRGERNQKNGTASHGIS